MVHRCLIHGALDIHKWFISWFVTSPLHGPFESLIPLLGSGDTLAIRLPRPFGLVAVLDKYFVKAARGRGLVALVFDGALFCLAGVTHRAPAGGLTEARPPAGARCVAPAN